MPRKLLSKIGLDGRPRWRQPAPKPPPKPRYPIAQETSAAAAAQREIRSARRHRLEELTAAFLKGISSPDEAAIMLAKAAALSSLQIERLQGAVVNELDRRGVIADSIVRLSGQLVRTLAALDARKAPRPAGQAGDAGGADLQAHLARLSREKQERQERDPPRRPPSTSDAG